MIELRENPNKTERALLVGVQFPKHSPGEAESLLEELDELVRNLGIAVAKREVAHIKMPHAKFLLGTGKVTEIVQTARDLHCDCIIFDGEISPAQQRNWEKESGLRVVDRQEVIIDIFSERARTKEAVLQVELARMQYFLPRLRRAWTHLNRQRGGGVTQRGEGEAQIELDARIVRERIAHLKDELGAVVRHRATQRKQRMKVPVPSASIVGYTNAGKSSLLNVLAQSDVYVADKLFATLDPTTRRITLGQSGQNLLLTDTVGFIRHLPHRLVEAFKATLEEAVVSDFLIHILDATAPELEAHRRTTLEVLRELGAAEKPTITAYNKIDLLDADKRRSLLRNGGEDACLISARTGEGLDGLKARMERLLEETITPLELLIPHNRYDLISRLHKAGCVVREEALDDGVRITANVPSQLAAQVKDFINNRKPAAKKS